MGDLKHSVSPINPWILHLHKMGLELKCPLCLNMLKGPVMLPCDHIFCNMCLPVLTQSGSNCPICKASYDSTTDLRNMPFLENMVNIYRSLESAFSASSRQPVFSGVTPSQIMEHGNFSTSTEVNDSCGGVSLLAHNNNKVLLGQHESGFKSNGLADKCNGRSEIKDGIVEQNVVMANECGDGQTAMNHLDQLSLSSPPCSGDVRDSENESNNHERTDNYLVHKSTQKDYSYRERDNRNLSSACGTEAGHLITKKRLKKFNGALLNTCSNDIQKMRSLSQTETPEACHYQLHTLVETNPSTQPSELLGDSFSGDIICGFCQSSTITKDTGIMLHFVNGKQVVGNEAALSIAVHVHKICFDWAPQIYFGDGAFKNLKEELCRAAKLKCSKCGIKGAALGCYTKSCRRTYHVPCALQIINCRWDCANFLLLCPSHASLKFPNENSNSRKCNIGHLLQTQMMVQQQVDFWKNSSDGAKEWVFCGSDLCCEEKCMLVKFGGMVGVPVRRFWKPDVTHVIAATDAQGACTRTWKVLMAILNGKWVLTIDWVKACMKSMRAVDEEPYEIKLDNYGRQNGPRTGRLRSLDNAPKLFDETKFYFVGDFVSSYKADLQRLVIAAGGMVLHRHMDLKKTSLGEAKIFVVYNEEVTMGCKLGEEEAIVRHRIRGAEAMAETIGALTVCHTWLLESVAACQLQPLIS